MTTTHNAPAATPALTVTVRDDSVVFTGAVNVHRYDRPSTSEIAAAICTALGEDPRGAHVHIVADEETVEDIAALVGGYDISLSYEATAHKGKHALRRRWDGADGADSANEADVGETQYDEYDDDSEHHPPTDEWETVPLIRPSTQDTKTSFMPAGALIVGAVCLVGLACAAAIWFVTGRGVDGEMAGEGGASISEGPETTTAPREHAATTVTLEQDGLSVELPVGFALEPDEDMWRATGPDPDFRLQLAVDPLYGVADEAVIDQIEREILGDPELRIIGRDTSSIDYKHMLPDGSQAEWRAWIDGGHQISIGCHTRTAPTSVQLATCSMAIESARFTPP